MTILSRVRTEFHIAFVTGNLFKKPSMCLSGFFNDNDFHISKRFLKKSIKDL